MYFDRPVAESGCCDPCPWVSRSTDDKIRIVHRLGNFGNFAENLRVERDIGIGRVRRDGKGDSAGVVVHRLRPDKHQGLNMLVQCDQGVE